MEFNPSMIEWQVLLKNIHESVGDISKIKYQMDEEDEIYQTISLIKNSHLLDKYLIEGEYSNEVLNIIKLLIANTKLKTDVSNLEDYSHIVNIMPLLSKCVLTNIILELNLTKQFCEIISSLPVQVAEELLSEVISCLKFCEPNILLNHSYECCKCIIKMVSLNHNQNMEIFIDIFNDILKDLSHINVNKVEGWTKNEIYELMGNHILILFKLILECSLASTRVCILLDKIILNCLNIFQAVTVNVFCLWTEVQHKSGQHLQTVISSEAYYVIEHVKNYKRAKELIQMLKTIAKKPKSINDIIEEADLKTILSYIDKCDENQHLWFQALLLSNIYDDERTISCLNKWSKLCTPHDACNILTKSANHSNNRELIFKCCEHLSIKDMQSVIEKYFDKNKLTANLNLGITNEQLTLMLNKISSNEELDKSLMKNICFLFLQNPEFFVTTFFERCLKKSIYIDNVQEIFKLLKNTAGILEFVRDIFSKMLKENPPSLTNIQCYKELINVLLTFNYLYDYIILCEIFVPQLGNLLNTEDYDTLLYTLQILNLISINRQLGDNILPFITLVIKITDELRYNFASFSMIKQCIIEEAVSLLQKYKNRNQDGNCYFNMDAFSNLNTQDPLTKYYVTMFYDSNKQNNFLEFALKDIPCYDENKKLTALTMILQRCCSLEWLIVAQEIQSRSSYQDALQKFVDIFRLIHALVDSAPDNQTTNRAFKFYLNQYAIIIKAIFKPQYNSFDDQLLLSEKVTYMLAVLNEKWSSEGLQFIELLSKKSLKHLREDKKFVVTLVTFKNPVLAKKISQIMVT